MKILHIIDHFGIGGAQTILKTIFEMDNGNENIFCFALRDNTKIKIDHPNVSFYKGYSKLNIKSLFELRKIIEHQNVGVLHCHLTKSMISGYLLKLLFFKDIKLIFHEHGRIFQHQKKYNYFIRKTQNKVDLYIAVSKATKDKLIEDANINPDKIQILYNSVNLNKFNCSNINKLDQIEKRAKIGLNETDFVLGFVGRLSKEKGCDILINSLPYISIPNFKLVVAGDGVETNRLEKLAASLNVKNKIIFLGYVNDVVQLYGLMDFLIVPSRLESFGLSVIEANAMKTPIIASNVCGLNEVISDQKTGLLFEPENEKDLAEKINLLIEDDELKMKLINNGLNNASNYSSQEYLNKLNKIYQN